MPTTPIFKGPLFASQRPRRTTGILSALPVARGVVNEEDFLNQKAGRPTRADVVQRKSKENNDEQ